MSGIGSHTKPVRGETDSWITPKEIIDSFPNRFDLDPCQATPQPWPCACNAFTIEDDGLSKDWSPYQRVWMNPPYGRRTSAWLEKLSRHGSGIALIFARTETKMFVEHVWRKASALLFLHGRLTFYRPDGKKGTSNSGGPSVLIAYGDLMATELRRATIEGTYIDLRTYDKRMK